MHNKNYIPCVKSLLKTLRFAFTEVFPPDIYVDERKLLEEYQLKPKMKRSDALLLLRIIEVFRSILRRGYIRLLDLGYFSDFNDLVELESNLDKYVRADSSCEFELI